jgi:hypothetical protein
MKRKKIFADLVCQVSAGKSKVHMTLHPYLRLLA